MASVRKRGDNTYRITVSNGYDRDGKKIVKMKTITLDSTLTEKQQTKEIERLAVLFEEEVKRGNYIDNNMKFEQFVEKWLVEYAEKHLERNTIRSYKIEIESKILPAIGHIRLRELQPLHIIKFLDNLTEDGVRLDGKSGGYSTRTIKYQLQIISSILQTAVFWQAVESNVARKVSPPKGIRREKRDNFFNEEQATAFLNYIDEMDIKYKALVNVTLFGGLRTEEVLALTWSDIDFVELTIDINKALSYVNGEQFIKSTKNYDSARKITLPLGIMEMLKQLKIQATSVKVFNMHYSTPYHWLRKQIARYNKEHKEKLPVINFHGLRHTSATILIAQGLDIKTVSGRLGHADSTTTLNIYGHYIKSRDKMASDVLDNVLIKKK